MSDNKPNKVIWHHTADSSAGPQYLRVNQNHQQRKFPISSLGFFGGYHVLIEKDGTPFQFRSYSEVGAHDKDENLNSIGIALAGNFSVEMPTPKQVETLGRLLEEIAKIYKIPASRIEPHRWGDNTECPGRLLDDQWAARVFLQHKLNWLQKILLRLLAQLAKLAHVNS